MVEEKKTIKIIELFGGIGACTEALKRLGIDVDIVDYVEIDKYAVASYNAINGTSFEPQDICEWNKGIDVDLIMHGSPCQDFSLAGKQAGGDEGSGTRSALMYETLRIVANIKPKYVLWENVKNILSKKHFHNFQNYLDEMKQLGYENYYQVLNAKDYGIPQNRERVFTISIRNDIDKGYEFPPKQELKLRLKDLLEDEVDEKYYLSERMTKFFMHNEQVQKEKGNGFRFGVSDGNIIAKAVTTKAGSRMDDNFIQYNNQRANQTIENHKEEIKENSFIAIKNANSKGYDEATEGDSIDLTYPNSTTRRGRVGHQVSQTILASDTKGVIVVGNYMPSNHEASRIVDNEGLAPTVKENHGTVTATNQDLRIRKLTPKECWRLMGFSDEAFDKAQKINSNSQLYKQAGNSIVVNVLVAILKQLIEEY